ncbi:hypothetical protein FX985_06349 [Pseudomonas extremaustralis]|uniref:Uncharacterized protein n=1 Tax=Pseudomonas extremaustralis TaxID=359110 RepID=A0A5M9IW84_9PSED|nr:hypothetical protein FX985_06349 [Pseudomonas extremaustralis]
MGDRQLRQHLRLGQQQLHAAVFEHVGQAFARVFRVQRHVCTAGLEHRQQANHHFNGTLQRQPHQYIRPDACLDQTMGQAIGAVVQLGIAQRHIAEVQRRCSRCAGDLRFNQLMHATLQRVVPRGGIPVAEHLAARGLRQRRQIPQALRCGAGQALQQVLEVRGQLLDLRLTEHLHIKAELEFQARACPQQDGQRVVGLLDVLHITEGQPGRRASGQRGGNRIVFKHQQRVEQRRATGARPTLDIEQGRVLVLTQAEVLCLYLLQPLTDPQGRVRGGDHRQGIDEQPDLLLHTRQTRRPPGHRGAEHHGVLAGLALQQQQPGGLHQRVQGDFVGLGKRLEWRGLRDAQGQGVAALGRRMLGRGGARQARRRLQRGQLAFPERLAGRRVLALQPANVVAVMPLQRRQRLADIVLQDLPQQLRPAPTVQQDVMVGEDQVKVIDTDTHQFQAEQRRPIQHETLRARGFAQRIQCRLRVWLRLPVVLDEGQGALAIHRLQRLRLVLLPDKPGAQHVVPRQHLLPGAFEARHVQAVEIGAQLADIDCVLILLVQAVEQHALLHR